LKSIEDARAFSKITVYKKYGGQRGYSGHVLNLSQDIQQFLNKLPTHVSALPILYIKHTGTNNTEARFRVQREKILQALLWLINNNVFYQDIVIHYNTLSIFPTDGISDDLQTLTSDSDTTSPTYEDTTGDVIPANEADTLSMSFMPHPENVQRQEEAIRSSIDGQDPLDWPSLGAGPLNEFNTAGLDSHVFPTLFPHGTGDPTCKGRHYPVSLTDAFKHLIKYSDYSPEVTHRWRLTSHPASLTRLST